MFSLWLLATNSGLLLPPVPPSQVPGEECASPPFFCLTEKVPGLQHPAQSLQAKPRWPAGRFQINWEAELLLGKWWAELQKDLLHPGRWNGMAPGAVRGRAPCPRPPRELRYSQLYITGAGSAHTPCDFLKKLFLISVSLNSYHVGMSLTACCLLCLFIFCVFFLQTVSSLRGKDYVFWERYQWKEEREDEEKNKEVLFGL